MGVIGILLRGVVERGARNQDYASLAARLQASRATVAGRIGQAADTPRNRDIANHVIGIERWAQRRLRTLLGEPLVLDEYDSYRPGDIPLPALREAWLGTRDEMLALVEELERCGIPATATVRHNDLADLSVRGWIMYLDNHATREIGRAR